MLYAREERKWWACASQEYKMKKERKAKICAKTQFEREGESAGRPFHRLYFKAVDVIPGLVPF